MVTLVPESERPWLLRQWMEHKLPAAVVLLLTVIPLFVWGGPWAALIFIIPACWVVIEVLKKADQVDRRACHTPVLSMLAMLLGGMGAGLLLLEQPLGRELIVLGAAGTFCNDIGAELSGKLWVWIGEKRHKVRKKVFPEVSQNKTVGGTVGGLVCGTSATVAAFLLVDEYWEALPLWVVPLAVIVPPLAVFGDWVESRAKRALGIKDFWATLGKHGGFCDRIDAISMVLIGVLAYYSIVRLMLWLYGLLVSVA